MDLYHFYTYKNSPEPIQRGMVYDFLLWLHQRGGPAGRCPQELGLCLFQPMRGNVVAQCLLLDCCAVAGCWADALSIFEHLEPSKELWWGRAGKVPG